MIYFCTYKRHPVRVQISNSDTRDELRAGHYEEVEVKEEFELLEKNLQQSKNIFIS